MKFLLILSLGLFSATTFPNEARQYKMMNKKMDKMSFEDAKAMKLKMIEEKTSMLDDEKKCVNDAKDKSALKGCMKDSWKEHKEMKAEMKEKMEEKMEENKKM